MKGTLSTKGLEKWLSALVEAGGNADVAAEEALAAGGDVAAAGMRERVAKDTHNLEEHIEASAPQANGNYHIVYIGVRQGSDADTVRYGNAQEFGSSSMAAHPYIRPTMIEDKARIMAAMRQVLKKKGTL